MQNTASTRPLGRKVSPDCAGADSRLNRGLGKVRCSVHLGLSRRTETPGSGGEDREAEEVSPGAQVASPVRLGSSTCPPHLCPQRPSSLCTTARARHRRPLTPSHCSNSPRLSSPRGSLRRGLCFKPSSFPCWKCGFPARFLRQSPFSPVLPFLQTR